MQRTRWLEAIGALLLIVAGLLFLFDNIGLLPGTQAVVRAGLFFSGGVVFLVTYLLDRGHWWPLIPGSALVGVAAAIFLGDTFPGAGEWAGAALFAWLAIGFAGVYLAQPRENWWAVIPGGAMVALVLVILASAVSAELAGVVFFLGLAAVFVAIYFAEINGQRHQWWALIPAGALLSLAAVVVLSSAGQEALAASGLFLGLGLTFGVLYLMRSEERSLGWAWIPAVALLGFGAVMLTVSSNSLFARVFWPLAIIVAGLVLLILNLRNRARRLE